MSIHVTVVEGGSGLFLRLNSDSSPNMAQNTILVTGAKIELQDDNRYCLSFNWCKVVSNGAMSIPITPDVPLTLGSNGLEIETGQLTLDNLCLTLTLLPGRQVVRIVSANVEDLVFS